MRTPRRLAALVLLVPLVVQAVNPGLAEEVRVRVGRAIRQELTREGLYPPEVIAEPTTGGADKTDVSGTQGSPKKAAEPSRTRPTLAGNAPSYTFETTNAAGQPARWRTCSKIPVVVDTMGAPPGFIGELRVALAQVDAATGLRFTITDIVNKTLTVSDSDHPVVPVVIGFQDTRALFSDANVAGLTSTATDPDTNTIIGGTVAFNTDLLGTYTPGSTGDDPRSALLAHELAHLAGLGHTPDPTQIMYPYTGFSRTYGAGDLKGLQALAPRGCALKK